MPKPIQASSYTFREIIEGGFIYVDKTRHIYELIRYNIGVYFLSRPRRFGKSLMISTLQEIFQGNRDLFQGLWLYESDYNWQTHPIIHIDFSRHGVKSAARLEQIIDYYVEEIAHEHDLTLRGFDYQTRFDNLIKQLGKQSRVVILIDEYDKPLIDNLNDLPEALAIRDVLRNFYAIIKAMDRYIRFVFITGISKFSKVGVFSTMNHLDDITMSPHSATMLGITEPELLDYFQDHLADLAAQTLMTESALLEDVRRWYDGFRFVEMGENVFNPYSLLQLFHHQRFSNYWFSTGTPHFLINLIKERDYDIQPIEQLEVAELAFDAFDIENLELVPLLVQTGYLTIKDFRQDEFGEVYTLSYPNYEVKNAFFTYLLSAYNDVEASLTDSHLRRLIYALQSRDLPQFFTILDVFFANIDYDLHVANEKYYQTIFYLIFTLLGVRISAEVKTNRGRIDAVIELHDDIFIFEFKLDGTTDDALEQIRDTEYAQKYRLKGKPITLVGANFDSKQRKIVDWQSTVNRD